MLAPVEGLGLGLGLVVGLAVVPGGPWGRWGPELWGLAAQLLTPRAAMASTVEVTARLSTRLATAG